MKVYGKKKYILYIYIYIISVLISLSASCPILSTVQMFECLFTSNATLLTFGLILLCDIFVVIMIQIGHFAVEVR